MAGTSPAKTGGHDALRSKCAVELTLTADNFEKYPAHLGLSLLDSRLE